METNKPLLNLVFHEDVHKYYDYEVTDELVERIRRVAAARFYKLSTDPEIIEIDAAKICAAVKDRWNNSKLYDIIVDVISNKGPTAELDHSYWEEPQVF